MKKEFRAIDCVITDGLDRSEKKYLSDYLEWMGLDSIHIHHSPNQYLLEDLLDKGAEILGIGRPSPETQNIWIETGVGRFWGYTEYMDRMPLYFFRSNENSLLVWLYSGDKGKDRVISAFFRSFGHRVIRPLEPIHLFPILRREKPDLVFLDWDSVERDSPEFFHYLDQYSREFSLPLFLGIKDYHSENVSTDLMKKITRYCRINLPKGKIFSRLLPGFLFTEKTPFPATEVQAIVINKPFHGNLQSLELEWRSLLYPEEIRTLQSKRSDETRNRETRIQKDSYRIWLWFDWLRDRI